MPEFWSFRSSLNACATPLFLDIAQGARAQAPQRRAEAGRAAGVRRGPGRSSFLKSTIIIIPENARAAVRR
eukprot:scaffold29011_cov111-Isochrysis_galbana.AAC.4